MHNFFLLTRGRTGSTAILDEIGKTSALALQEIFTNAGGSSDSAATAELDPNALPYDTWLTLQLGQDFHGAPAIDQPALHMRILGRALPRLTKLSGMAYRTVNRWYLHRYLENIEFRARSEGRPAFIFKLLSHQIAERHALLGVLNARAYRAVLLTRKNVVRQVLSGMVAAQRGVYNSKVRRDAAPCHIDIEKLMFSVAWEMRCNEENRALPRGNNFDFIEISYEDYCVNRASFYRKLLPFMGLPADLPALTDYYVMIPDIRHAIENFSEVEACVNAAFGMEQ
jgi:hypothetical protein